MIKLFKYEGYSVTVEPEAIMLAPFKAIWDRDKRKDKSMAMQELAYIYFMSDPRSDYQYLVDEEVRKEEVIKGLGMPTKWKEDDVKALRNGCRDKYGRGACSAYKMNVFGYNDRYYRSIFRAHNTTNIYA